MPAAVHADQWRFELDPPVVRDSVAGVQRGFGGAVLEVAARRLDLDGHQHLRRCEPVPSRLIAAHHEDVGDPGQLPPEADLHTLRDGERLGRDRLQPDTETHGDSLVQARR